MTLLLTEMGLGKTLQVLSFLVALLELHGITGPHLIIMPLSVITSWRSDLEKYVSAGVVDVLVHLGTRNEREEKFDEWYTRVKEQYVHHKTSRIFLCMTSYTFAMNDADILGRLKRTKRSELSWEYLIVDEAHRLKNSESKLFGCLLKLKSRRHLLLTGTPLQNNLKELWSLLHFILPHIFADFEEFSSWFNHPFDSLENSSGNKKRRKRKPQGGMDECLMCNIESVVMLYMYI
jgi:ATP-dependent DNA helicase